MFIRRCKMRSGLSYYVYAVEHQVQLGQNVWRICVGRANRKPQWRNLLHTMNRKAYFWFDNIKFYLDDFKPI